MATDEFTDAIALLKADHRKVEDLFAKFESAKGQRKQQLATQICNELTIHMMLEEEIFYPTVEREIEEDDVAEAYVEHDGCKVLMRDILSQEQAEDDYYDAKVKVLQEEVEHHVKEEEAPSKGIFAQTRQTDIDLVAMRDQMLARKQELMRQAEDGVLPPPTMHAVEG
ncbi:MAG TPA: hemerythrin domain-containing protein [Novosphingobium sp.]